MNLLVKIKGEWFTGSWQAEKIPAKLEYFAEELYVFNDIEQTFNCIKGRRIIHPLENKNAIMLMLNASALDFSKYTFTP